MRKRVPPSPASPPAGACTSGALARRCGVSADTLRHYERVGVLAEAPRRANGYRLYPAEAVERIRLVRRALVMGFTLDELARILGARDAGRAPCREVRALATRKLAGIEERLRELAALRDALLATLVTWDARLRDTPPGRPARLLEALSLPPVAPQPPSPSNRRRMPPTRTRTRRPA